MKVTYNWLKDFVQIRLSAAALADKLTMAGLEVTSLEAKDGDFVFEIEITANRPDLLSVVGIAREVAAITNKKLKLGAQYSVLSTSQSRNRKSRIEDQKFKIKIEDQKDCPLYTAKIIRDVRVGPSPGWIKKRLELVGCRSVNNIVDITNYILFERGEPLHAFDLDTLIPSEIIVRRAKNNEEIIVIDGTHIQLSPQILVIADPDKAVAIAGVMGGKDTEVGAKTKNILLEAAVFNPILIRHARQRLGLRSESAYRFERGIDLGIVEEASFRATRLIYEIAAGQFCHAKSLGSAKTKPKFVNFKTGDANKALGTEIKADRAKKILGDLGFQVKAKAKNNFLVGIPSFRQDVNSNIDLTEEIARIFGYPQIPTSLPAIKPQVTTYTARDLISEVKNILTGLGLNEVITYSLVDERALQQMKLKDQSCMIEVMNPLTKNEAVLRPTLILSLARCIAYNLSQQQDYVNIFEVAKVFSQDSGHCKEEWRLGIALCGTRSRLMPEQGVVKDNAGPLNFKGISAALFARLGIQDYTFHRLSDGQLALSLGQEKIGRLLSLAKNILDELDIKNKEVWIAEISVEKLISYINLQKKFTRLPVYPAITRDISIVVKEEVLAEEILKSIREKVGPLLEEVRIVDYYKGKQIPCGLKGLTISCLYRSCQRTLTEAEINPLHALAATTLKEKFSATIR